MKYRHVWWTLNGFVFSAMSFPFFDVFISVYLCSSVDKDFL